MNQTELATEEDCRYEIDRWANLFKAATWEDLRMIAEKNKYMSEVAEEMYQLNEDEIIREKCLAREEYYRQERSTQRRMQELEAKLANNVEPRCFAVRRHEKAPFTGYILTGDFGQLQKINDRGDI